MDGNANGGGYHWCTDCDGTGIKIWVARAGEAGSCGLLVFLACIIVFRKKHPYLYFSIITPALFGRFYYFLYQISLRPCLQPNQKSILFNCPNKQSDSDPIPTWLLNEFSSVLFPTITNIVNLSLISGQFHPLLKQSTISPLLTKPTLDKDQLSSYRPISNISCISKIIEQINWLPFF